MDVVVRARRGVFTLRARLRRVFQQSAPAARPSPIRFAVALYREMAGGGSDRTVRLHQLSRSFGDGQRGEHRDGEQDHCAGGVHRVRRLDYGPSS